MFSSCSSSERRKKRKHVPSLICDYACCNRDASRMPHGSVGRFANLSTTASRGSPPPSPKESVFSPRAIPDAPMFGLEPEVPTVTAASFRASFGVTSDDKKDPIGSIKPGSGLVCQPPSLTISSEDDLDGEFQEEHACWLDHFEESFGFRPPEVPTPEQMEAIAPVYLNFLNVVRDENKENIDDY